MRYSLPFLRMKYEGDSNELKGVTICMVKLVQRETLSRKLKILEGNQIDGRLIPLDPFLDSEGLFRVGGRLSYSDLTYSRNHPILLPKKHNSTHLIIRDQHLKLLYSATQATLKAIRNNYWIVAEKTQ